MQQYPIARLDPWPGAATIIDGADGSGVDTELHEACDLLNGRVGFETLSSCSGHGKEGLHILFRASLPDWMFEELYEVLRAAFRDRADLQNTHYVKMTKELAKPGMVPLWWLWIEHHYFWSPEDRPKRFSMKEQSLKTAKEFTQYISTFVEHHTHRTRPRHARGTTINRENYYAVST